MFRYLALFGVLALGCRQGLWAGHKALSNPEASVEAKAVYAYVSALEGGGILSGQQETPRGDGQLGDEIEYIEKTSGRLPAILGLDFITYAGVTDKARDWWRRGGLPSICWHWGAPGLGEGFESSQKTIDMEDALKPGTEANKQLMADLDKAADALQVLRDAKVPVLWRPLHEMNGGWFWWGKCGPESFKKLWIVMYRHFTQTRKLNNLIWVFGYTAKPDAAWYPGDDYVDIAGADTYAVGVQRGMYQGVKAITGDRMPLAYHECGPMPEPEILSQAGPRWVWFLTWHTKHIRQQNKPDDLKRIYNHPYVITLDELPNWAKLIATPKAIMPTTALSVPAAKAAAKTIASEALQIVGAEDPRFLYEGRIDLRNPASPVLIWQGSKLSFEFEGERLVLFFGPTVGQSHFDLIVDGHEVLVSLRKEDWTTRFECPVKLGKGWHRASLVKRSEADSGHASFEAIGVTPGAQVKAVARRSHTEAYLFFGDSITVGACNLDGPEDQWEDRSTHNNALSYGALTAKAMDADYRNIAVSGMGICIGYVDKKAGQVWNRLYPQADAPVYHEKGWEPTHIFVNFGENDDSFSKNQMIPFPAGFAEGYVDLVREIRKVYPKARITLLRGGMAGGATSEVLREAWEKAVASIEATDTLVDHYVFKHWSVLHPRFHDDQAMSLELVSKLQSSPRSAR